MTVLKPSGLRVTLYNSPKSYGHALLVFSGSPELERPKSNLTAESEVLLVVADSSLDLPRYSQRTLRAKPCCGREEVAWPDDGGAPKTLFSCTRQPAVHFYTLPSKVNRREEVLPGRRAGHLRGLACCRPRVPYR